MALTSLDHRPFEVGGYRDFLIFSNAASPSLASILEPRQLVRLPDGPKRIDRQVAAGVLFAVADVTGGISPIDELEQCRLPTERCKTPLSPAAVSPWSGGFMNTPRCSD